MVEMGKLLPHLDAPVDPATGQPLQMRSSGGISNDAKSMMLVRFTVKDSAENIARQFARQMARQGWTQESSWSGPSTAGSTWSKGPVADVPLHALLSVAAVEDNQFSAMFRLVKTK